MNDSLDRIHDTMAMNLTLQDLVKAGFKFVLSAINTATLTDTGKNILVTSGHIECNFHGMELAGIMKFVMTLG